MPTKTSFVTEQHLRNTTLPNHGKRYSVIPHGFIIDETRAQLAAAGFTIGKELYKSSLDGQMAQGIYHLNYGQDSEMGLMFAWSNSYNKMMRFKCAIGAYVFICSNGVVSGDMGNYNRKHTGSSAKQDVIQSITNQIGNAKLFYDNLVADKEMLKQVNLTSKEKGEIVGRLFIEQDVLTLTQVGMIQKEINKPTHAYSNNPNSAWDLYNYVTLALKDSHPLSFLTDHQKVHNYFVNEFGQLQGIYNVDEQEPTSPQLSAMEEELVVEEATDFSDRKSVV